MGARHAAGGDHRHGAVHHRGVRARRPHHAAPLRQLLDARRRGQPPAVPRRGALPHRARPRGRTGRVPVGRGRLSRCAGRGVRGAGGPPGGGQLHDLPARAGLRDHLPGVQHEPRRRLGVGRRLRRAGEAGLVQQRRLPAGGGLQHRQGGHHRRRAARAGLCTVGVGQSRRGGLPQPRRAPLRVRPRSGTRHPRRSGLGGRRRRRRARGWRRQPDPLRADHEQRQQRAGAGHRAHPAGPRGDRHPGRLRGRRVRRHGDGAGEHLRLGDARRGLHRRDGPVRRHRLLAQQRGPAPLASQPGRAGDGVGGGDRRSVRPRQPGIGPRGARGAVPPGAGDRCRERARHLHDAAGTPWRRAQRVRQHDAHPLRGCGTCATSIGPTASRGGARQGERS